MRRIELSDGEFEILATLLKKEIEETRVELHHTQRAEYRQFLREREQALKEMLAKLAG
jgi:hypothetical protein